MMRTATAAVKASCAGCPVTSQPSRVASGQQHHDGHEDGRDAVGEALDGGLAVLGVLDEAGHLGELGVCADPGGAHDEPAADVGGGTDHRVAGPDLDGDGLTGEHGGVDRGGALDDDAVGGDLLAGTGDEQVADEQLADGDAGLRAGRSFAAQDGDVLGAHVQQRTQGGTGLPLGPGLEVASGQDEAGDRGGDLQVEGVAAVCGRQQAERHPHAGHPGGAEEQRPQRPQVRRGHADGDEGVHRRGTMLGVRPGSLVERQCTPHHDRRRERQREPLPVVELQGRDHRHQQDRQRENHADDQALPELGGLVVDHRGCGSGVVVHDGRRGQERGVAGRLDGGDEVGRGDGAGEGHLRLLRRVVHRRGDTVEPVELLLDAHRARRARHPADRELDRRRAGFSSGGGAQDGSLGSCT